MNPQQKLDALVAQHVLKWRNEGTKWFHPEADKEVTLQPFSVDLALAWQVAEKICEQGYRLQIDGSRIWQARFYKSVAHTLETHAFSATSREPASAICLAALAVKGIQTSPY